MQGALNTKTMLKKKNMVEGLTLSEFKTHYKDTVTETVWCWHKDRQIDQWKGRASTK